MAKQAPSSNDQRSDVKNPNNGTSFRPEIWSRPMPEAIEQMREQAAKCAAGIPEDFFERGGARDCLYFEASNPDPLLTALAIWRLPGPARPQVT